MAAVSGGIESLFEKIESSLQDFAIRLDLREMADVEATIRVLESTLRDEGLG